MNNTMEMLDETSVETTSSISLRKNYEKSFLEQSKSTGVIDYFLPDVAYFHEISKDEKLLSDPVMIRSLPWRILVIRRSTASPSGSGGEDSPPAEDKFFSSAATADDNNSLPSHPLSVAQLRCQNIAFFLLCNGESNQPRWSCHARAELWALTNPARPTLKHLKERRKEIDHIFHSRENDWGFTNFLCMADALDPQFNLLHPDPVTGRMGLRLRIYVLADPPHGACWDSRSLTGYVGLKNQGATCYMNSLLQALFFTNELRKAVYAIPMERCGLTTVKSQAETEAASASDDASTGGVALALQRVFYDLQYSKEAVGTRKLTRSFGWQTLDSFMQHDAQELCRVLLDNLETKMKQCTDSHVAGTIPRLFCGKMQSYIRCKQVQFESKREENFYDIQLKVKGNNDVYDAFREYVEVETLDGDNKYDAGNFGLQDAEKGVKFLHFPPVLYLHLMRFQYDFNTDSNVKINDRFEFPFRLHLKEFMDESADPLNNAQFILHAVLVHAGDHQGGHYYIFINPRGDGSWLKFDDDIVTTCSSYEAIDMNYGGGNSAGILQNYFSKDGRPHNDGNDNDDLLEDEETIWMRLKKSSRNTFMSPSTNAYMLVYIQESSMEQVLAPIHDVDIPLDLRTRLYNEQMAREAKQMEQSHLCISLYIFTERHMAITACQWPSNFDRPPLTRIQCSKKTSYDDLLKCVSEQLNLPSQCVRLWIVKQQRETQSHFDLLPLTANAFLDSDGLSGIQNLWCQYLPQLDTHLQQLALSPPPSPLGNNSFLTVLDVLFPPSKAVVPPEKSTSDVVLVVVKYYCTPDMAVTPFLDKLSSPSSLPTAVNGSPQHQQQQQQPQAEFGQLPLGEMIYAGHLLANNSHCLIDLLSPFLFKLGLQPSESLRLYLEADRSQMPACLPTSWYLPHPANSHNRYQWHQQSLATLLQHCRVHNAPNEVHGVVLVLAGGTATLTGQPVSAVAASVSTTTSNSLDTAVFEFYKQRQHHNFLLFIPMQEMHTTAAAASDLFFDNSSDQHHSATHPPTPITLEDLPLGSVVSLDSYLAARSSSAQLGAPLLALNSHMSYWQLVERLCDSLKAHFATSGQTTTVDAKFMQLLLQRQGQTVLSPLLSDYRCSLKDLLRNCIGVFYIDFSSAPLPWLSGCTPAASSQSAADVVIISPSSNYCAEDTLTTTAGQQQQQLIASIAVPQIHRICTVYHFFYRITDLPIQQVESMRLLRIPFLPWDQVGRTPAVREVIIRLLPTSIIQELLEAVCQQVNSHGQLRKDGEPLRVEHLRLWELIYGHRLHLEFGDWSQAIPYSLFLPTHYFRVDEKSPEECDVSPSDVILRVAHFYNEPTNLHGVPFTVCVRVGDSYCIVAERIRQRLEVSVKEFNQWKVCLVTNYSQVQIIKTNSEASIPLNCFAPQKSANVPWIGLDHRPTHKRSLEKAIKIHN